MAIASYVVVVSLVTGVAAWSFSNLIMTGTKASMALADSVAFGVQRAMEECRVQFQWERWNCPEEAFSVFPRDRGKPATREMAFVHAIVSASIMYSLTKNCSDGDFDGCGCDQTKKGAMGSEGWSWGGCSDNIQFGEKMAMQFLDSQEMGTDTTASVNLHNNLVGRLAVKKTMKKLCKCHGVSGSCATRTCLMRLSDFRQVGNYLKNAYATAQKIEENIGLHAGGSQLSRRSLVFMEESPDYCHGDNGTSGTRGRECSRRKGRDVDTSEKKSCRNLCRGCGLRIRRRTDEIVTSCNCKFKWCCEVKCDVCRKKVQHYMCT